MGGEKSKKGEKSNKKRSKIGAFFEHKSKAKYVGKKANLIKA